MKANGIFGDFRAAFVADQMPTFLFLDSTQEAAAFGFEFEFGMRGVGI